MEVIPQDNMNKIIIIGAGGHAAELIDYLIYMNHTSVTTSSQNWEIVGLIDDSEANYHQYQYRFPYLGTIQAHQVRNDVGYIMGIANMKYRRTIIEELLQKKAQFISIIHPTALVSPSAKIGVGCVISHNVSIGPKAVIGDFNLINSRCTIGHDTTIEAYNFLSPQVVTGGFAVLGEENFIGTNGVVLPGITLGNKNTVAAGMIVDKNVTDNTTVFHRFKEKMMVINAQ
ncbi:acetyltransferase [Flavobacterium sp. LMO6]|uniref:acetyltransferase n=2 Tax=unclassified Flavobacterium TaxID=196869 RepID=UPI00193ACFE5|nr:acetyltransferase [Flavobacterium sp. LMO6]